MKMLIHILCLSALCSCSGYKMPAGTVINEKDGVQWVENKEAGVTLRYYGDYWFHDLTRSNTLNWDDAFMRSVKASKGTYLFGGHTRMAPFCTTIGVLYPNIDVQSLLTGITAELKKSGAVSVITADTLAGTINFKRLSYELPDKKLKINRRFLEYYCVPGRSDVLRLVFWTTEANENWLQGEASGIITSIK